MEWLNYHHLYYFWTLLKQGSLKAACEKLSLAQSTVSEQIHRLEESLGEPLLQREGRKLVPTEMGRVVYNYADEIFSLGQELLNTVNKRPTGRPLRLVVGASMVLPKLVVHRLLEPVFDLQEPLKLTSHEGRMHDLLASLALHEVDLVLSDTPIPPGSAIKAHNHFLGESSISFFAAPKLVAQAKKYKFPDVLTKLPMILPTEHTALRASLERWFYSQNFQPEIKAEFDDSALLKVFGQKGLGIFPMPSVVDAETKKQYGVHLIGKSHQVKERFYAISTEKRIKTPCSHCH